MKFALIIYLVVTYLLIMRCPTGWSLDIIEAKTSSILFNLMNSDDHFNYAKKHGISVMGGMVRVVITVNEKFSSEALFSKYDLKDYQKRGNIITSYIPINSLKELCKDPSVIYIRLPHKFNAES